MRKSRCAALQYMSHRRATELLLIVALVLLAHLSSPADAAADCPPFSAGTSFIEVITRHHRGPGPVTDAELMELMDKGLFSPLLVSPSSGPAPLTVDIRWWVFPVESPLRIEFDSDGDGVPEWSQPGFHAEAGQERHTYQQEGQYTFTVRVHARGGQVTTYTAPVKVLAPAAFDAELQGRWTTFKAALRKADIPVALECIHSKSRSRYRDGFTALSQDLSQNVDWILTRIRLVEHRGAEAIYEMLRADDGITLSYEVRFRIDEDGVWRLRSF